MGTSARALARRAGVVAKRASSAELGPLDRAEQGRPVPVVVQQVQEEPAPVGAAVEIRERARRLLARRPRLDARAGERRLDLDRVPPEPVGQERRRDHGAAARAATLVERGHDRGEERHARRVIAHPRQRARGRRIRRRLGEVHQAGARPERRRVEAGAPGLVAALAVRGHRGVDEPRIERRQIGPANAEPPARIERRVGDEDVGALDEAVEHARARPPRGDRAPSRASSGCRRSTGSCTGSRRRRDRPCDGDTDRRRAARS